MRELSRRFRRNTALSRSEPLSDDSWGWTFDLDKLREKLSSAVSAGVCVMPMARLSNGSGGFLHDMEITGNREDN
jgi:hypothetical protein